MRKAYSVIVTLIALGLLGYILAVPRALPDQKADARAAAASQPIQESTASGSGSFFRSLSGSSSSSKTYILNTNTRRFHLPSCSSVQQMADKNKKTYTGSRYDLIEQGFAPCQRCHP